MPDPASATEATIERIVSRAAGYEMLPGAEEWDDGLRADLAALVQQAHAAGVALGREQAATRLRESAQRERERAKSTEFEERWVHNYAADTLTFEAEQLRLIRALGPQAAGTGDMP